VFYKKYRADGCGRSAFNPKMMVVLLLYGYSLGERSSRRLEILCERDVGFRVVAANQKPDHSTISRFRKKYEKELEGLFVNVLKMCADANMLKVGTIALDGTKMEANASLSSNRTDKYIESEVKKIFDEAEQRDREEDNLYGKTNRGDELPEELRSRFSRLKRLKECKDRREREAEEAIEKQRKEIREQEAPRGRIPEGLSKRELMERKLLTKRGKWQYSKRGQMIESVFGQIKDVRGIKRFLRRGLHACASEWKLICATHNLLKLFRSGKAGWA